MFFNQHPGIGYLASLVVILAIALIFAYRRYLAMRDAAVLQFFDVIKRIRGLRRKLRATIAVGAEYKEYHQEPYVEKYRDFQAETQHAMEIVCLYSTQRLGIIRSIPKRPQNKINAIIVAFLRWPFVWRILQKQIDQLGKDLEESQGIINLVSKSLRTIIDLPWQIAQRARALDRRSEDSGNILKKLYDYGINGQTIDQARDEYKDIFLAVRNIPQILFTSSRQDITRLQSRIIHQAIFTHGILEDNDCTSQSLYQQLKYWSKVHFDCNLAVRKLLKLLKYIFNIIPRTPAPIDLTVEKNTLEEITEKAYIYYQEYHTPTIEALGPYFCAKLAGFYSITQTGGISNR